MARFRLAIDVCGRFLVRDTKHNEILPVLFFSNERGGAEEYVRRQEITADMTNEEWDAWDRATRAAR